MRVETTNVLVVNASMRAQGIFPYEITDDFEVIPLDTKTRREFKEPIGIYWCNSVELEKIGKLCAQARKLSSLRKQQMILETELFLSVVDEMCNV